MTGLCRYTRLDTTKDESAWKNGIPEHFTSFEHLCEVTLSAVREKTEAEQIYLWLRAPTPQLYHYRPEQGLLCLNADLLGSLELPLLFIERSPRTRPVAGGTDRADPCHLGERRAEIPRLRACFPSKRHKGLEAVVYLETRRRLDRLPRRQQQSIQLLMHYLAAELESRRLAGRVDLEQDQRLHTQADPSAARPCRTPSSACCRRCTRWASSLPAATADRLLHDAVALARQELQFDRVAIFLTDGDVKTMHGTWGTNEAGSSSTSAISSAPFRITPWCRRRCAARDYVLVLEDTPLYYEKQEVGRGWNAMVSAVGREHPMGWIAADNLLWRRPLKAYQSEIFKQYAAMLSQLLIRQRTQSALERFNRELEQRVQERTRQLADTNRALEGQSPLSCCRWRIP